MRIVLTLLVITCNLHAQDTVRRIQGSGTPATESRPAEGFDKIDFKYAGRVEIVVGQSFDVQITADDNVLPFISTEVVGGELVIANNNSTKEAEVVTINTKTPFVAKIQLPKLAKVSLSGSADLVIEEIDEEELEVAFRGTGSLTAKGKVGNLSARLMGVGKLDLSDVTAQTASVRLMGKGDVLVSSERSLDVSISGVGDVVYSDDPDVTKSISGRGTVTKSPPSKEN